MQCSAVQFEATESRVEILVPMGLLGDEGVVACVWGLVKQGMKLRVKEDFWKLQSGWTERIRK